MKRHHYRVVNPVRFFLFILISVMLITFSCYTIAGYGRAEASAMNTYAQVIVQDNDTLWDIASRCNPDRHDIRSIIYEIYDINELTSGEIHPGDVIFVPVY